jgi:osmoprotectant transport system substrate-binding protein
MKAKQLLIGVGLGIAALLLTACGANSNPLGEATSPQPSQPGQTSAASAPVVVGSADFTESKILAEIYSQA